MCNYIIVVVGLISLCNELENYGCCGRQCRFRDIGIYVPYAGRILYYYSRRMNRFDCVYTCAVCESRDVYNIFYTHAYNMHLVVGRKKKKKKNNKVTVLAIEFRGLTYIYYRNILYVFFFFFI